jgi:hypothetical protein
MLDIKITRTATPKAKPTDETKLGFGKKFSDHICNVMVDKRPGSEWFWEVDADGKPSSRKPILEPWKCPYHNGRMCMELIRRNPDVTV